MIVVPIGFERCSWQGLGGGASYEDMGCADGEIVDMDSCDEPGGPCCSTEESCPNCDGQGFVPIGHKHRGPMALVRQRELNHLCDMVWELETKDNKDQLAAICKDIEAMFGLVRKLEER